MLLPEPIACSAALIQRAAADTALFIPVWTASGSFVAAVVGLVVPSGLTFNADGSAIYFTIGAVFLAQATNTPLSALDQVTILGVLLLTSKGSAGVAGAGFVTLAATLAAMDKVPVAGLVLLLGVDSFMAQARSVTNTIGNAVGALTIAAWEGVLDRETLGSVLGSAGVSAGLEGGSVRESVTGVLPARQASP